MRNKCENFISTQMTIQKRNSNHMSNLFKAHIWAKIRKKLVPMNARMNVSGFAKWQRVPLGSICAFGIHWCSTCRWDEAELAGGSQLRSLRGVSIRSYPTTVAECPYWSTGGTSLSLTLFALFQLEFSMSDCLYKRALSLFLFSRKVEFATNNLCQW